MGFYINESPAYKSNKDNFKEFFDYVTQNKNIKECYFVINKLRIYSNSIIHSFNKHKSSYNNWMDVLNNLDNIINIAIADKTIGGRKVYLIRIDVDEKSYGTCMIDCQNYGIITTVFLDNPNSIDSWIKEGSARTMSNNPTSSLGYNPSSVVLSGQNPNNIINEIKRKIKSFNEDFTKEPDDFETESEREMDREFQNQLDKDMKQKEVLLLSLYTYLKARSWVHDISLVDNTLRFIVDGKYSSKYAFEQWRRTSKVLPKFKLNQYNYDEDDIEVIIS